MEPRGGGVQERRGQDRDESDVNQNMAWHRWEAGGAGTGTGRDEKDWKGRHPETKVGDPA